MISATLQLLEISAKRNQRSWQEAVRAQVYNWRATSEGRLNRRLTGYWASTRQRRRWLLIDMEVMVGPANRCFAAADERVDPVKVTKFHGPPKPKRMASGVNHIRVSASPSSFPGA